MAKKKSKGKSKLPVFIIIAAILVIVFAGGYLVFDHFAHIKAEKDYNDLKEEILLEDLENADFTESEGDAPEIPDVLVDGAIPIDFNKLQSYNEEMIAWIRVPNTNIDYPIARHQGDNDDYYLRRNMYGEAQSAGCIYMQQSVNSGDFTDNNTILYGHNMNNGSMFANLHKYEEQAFFDANRYIYVYTSEKALVYEVFAAYLTNDTNIGYTIDLDDKATYAGYLESVMNMSTSPCIISDDIVVTSDDKIITLSTCAKNLEDNRYIVQGVLVEEILPE